MTGNPRSSREASRHPLDLKFDIERLPVAKAVEEYREKRLHRLDRLQQIKEEAIDSLIVASIDLEYLARCFHKLGIPGDGFFKNVARQLETQAAKRGDPKAQLQIGSVTPIIDSIDFTVVEDFYKSIRALHTSGENELELIDTHSELLDKIIKPEDRAKLDLQLIHSRIVFQNRERQALVDHHLKWLSANVRVGLTGLRTIAKAGLAPADLLAPTIAGLAEMEGADIWGYGVLTKFLRFMDKQVPILLENFSVAQELINSAVIQLQSTQGFNAFPDLAKQASSAAQANLFDLARIVEMLKAKDKSFVGIGQSLLELGFIFDELIKNTAEDSAAVHRTKLTERMTRLVQSLKNESARDTEKKLEEFEPQGLISSAATAFIREELAIRQDYEQPSKPNPTRSIDPSEVGLSSLKLPRAFAEGVPCPKERLAVVMDLLEDITDLDTDLAAKLVEANPELLLLTDGALTEYVSLLRLSTDRLLEREKLHLRYGIPWSEALSEAERYSALANPAQIGLFFREISRPLPLEEAIQVFRKCELDPDYTFVLICYGFLQQARNCLPISRIFQNLELSVSNYSEHEAGFRESFKRLRSLGFLTFGSGFKLNLVPSNDHSPLERELRRYLERIIQSPGITQKKIEVKPEKCLTEDELLELMLGRHKSKEASDPSLVIEEQLKQSLSTSEASPITASWADNATGLFHFVHRLVQRSDLALGPRDSVLLRQGLFIPDAGIEKFAYEYRQHLVKVVEEIFARKFPNRILQISKFVPTKKEAYLEVLAHCEPGEALAFYPEGQAAGYLLPLDTTGLTQVSDIPISRDRSALIHRDDVRLLARTELMLDLAMTIKGLKPFYVGSVMISGRLIKLRTHAIDRYIERSAELPDEAEGRIPRSYCASLLRVIDLLEQSELIEEAPIRHQLDELFDTMTGTEYRHAGDWVLILRNYSDGSFALATMLLKHRAGRFPRLQYSATASRLRA